MFYVLFPIILIKPVLTENEYSPPNMSFLFNFTGSEACENRKSTSFSSKRINTTPCTVGIVSLSLTVKNLAFWPTLGLSWGDEMGSFFPGISILSRGNCGDFFLESVLKY